MPVNSKTPNSSGKAGGSSKPKSHFSRKSASVKSPTTFEGNLSTNPLFSQSVSQRSPTSASASASASAQYLGRLYKFKEENNEIRFVYITHRNQSNLSLTLKYNNGDGEWKAELQGLRDGNVILQGPDVRAIRSDRSLSAQLIPTKYQDIENNLGEVLLNKLKEIDTGNFRSY